MENDEYIKPRKIGLINGETHYITIPNDFGVKGQYVSIEYVSDDEIRIKLLN